MSVVASEVSNKVRESFNFTVDKFPLAGPDGMSTPWYGLFRSDTGSCVGKGSVSQRYMPHTTEDVCTLVDAAQEAFDGDIDVKCHFRNGHYVSVQPTKAERRSVFGEADNVWPRVIIAAGFDGKSFKATMGYYRDLCANLSIMKMVEGTSVSIRHTSGLRNRMDSLIRTFNVLKDSWATLTDVIAQLERTPVQMVEFLDAIYGQPEEGSKRGTTVHTKRTEAIFRRLQEERFRSGRTAMKNDWSVSAWEAYNAVQGFTQHEAQSKKNFKSEFDKILRAANDASVLKAERIVMSLVS